MSQPDEVAAAVGSCRSTIGLDKDAAEEELIAGGWKVDKRPNSSLTLLRHSRNAAVILNSGAQLGRSCWVRARLKDDDAIGSATSAIERKLGVSARRKQSDPDYRLWRVGEQLVALENFDDGPGSPRHVIQLVIGELPKEIR